MIKLRTKIQLLFVALLLVVFAPLQQVLAAGTNQDVTIISAPLVDYLALGDSLAAGQSPHKEIGKGYTDYLAELLHAEGYLQSFNKGFAASGYKTTDVLKDLQENVSKAVNNGDGSAGATIALQESIAMAEIITLSIGANDVLTHIAIDKETGAVAVNEENITPAMVQVGTNIHLILKGIYEINPDVQVYVMGYYNPFPYLNELYQLKLNSLLVSLNGTIQKGMTGTGAIFVPTDTLIAESFKTYLTNPEDIHLSDAGYMKVSEQFAKYIQNANEPEPEKDAFSDIEKHSAKEYINEAAKAGLIKGYKDGTFRPNDHLTRAQSTSLIVRTLGLQPTQQAPFLDIQKYAAETQVEIAAGYSFGIIKGYGHTFKPGKNVTNAQLALMIARAYIVYKQGEEYVLSQPAPFTDISGYDVETQTAIAILYELGVVDGSNGKFMPNAYTTRAQAAKMLVEFRNSLQ